LPITWAPGKALEHASDETPVAIDDVSLARAGPSLDVGRPVANIVEALFAEPLDQRRRLGLARHVDRRIGRDHAGDRAQPLRQRLDPAAVRSRRQPDLAPFYLRRPDEGDRFVAKRDQLGIMRDPVGEARLEIRLAGRKPQRQPPRLQRMPGEELQGTLVQQVGANERAVDIDDQWHRAVGLARPHRWTSRGAPAPRKVKCLCAQ
jgi:hypothetical protein